MRIETSFLGSTEYRLQNIYCVYTKYLRQKNPSVYNWWKSGGKYLFI